MRSMLLNILNMPQPGSYLPPMVPVNICQRDVFHLYVLCVLLLIETTNEFIFA